MTTPNALSADVDLMRSLNQILLDLGNAVRDGAEDVAEADRRAAGVWGR
jgi:hypothetical protein